MLTGAATQGGAASAPQSIPAPPKQEPTSKPTETTSGAPVPTSTPARRGRIRRRGAIHIVDEDDDFLPAPTQRRPSSPQPAPMEEVVEEETEPALPVQPPAWRSHVPAESKKRRAPTPPPIDDKDSMLDLMDFLPGSRIVKRRKMAEAEERARQEELGQVAEPEPEPMSEVEIVKVEKVEKPVKAAARGKKALVKPETPYETYVREMREKEEEQALKEEKLAMEGIDVNGLRNLAIVETFKVQPRGSRPVRGSFGSKGAGWKPEWDGRKNFKGFVRSGGERSFGGPRKIVGLVASKGKNNRMGDGDSALCLWEIRTVLTLFGVKVPGTRKIARHRTGIRGLKSRWLQILPSPTTGFRFRTEEALRGRQIRP